MSSSHHIHQLLAQAHQEDLRRNSRRRELPLPKRTPRSAINRVLLRVPRPPATAA